MRRIEAHDPDLDVQRRRSAAKRHRSGRRPPGDEISEVFDSRGGDFFREERSDWDPETLLEERYDVERAMRRRLQ
jgi:hypothetical protein